MLASIEPSLSILKLPLAVTVPSNNICPGFKFILDIIFSLEVAVITLLLTLNSISLALCSILLVKSNCVANMSVNSFDIA